MKTIILAGCLLTVFCHSLIAQDTSAYRRMWFVKDGDTLPYRLLLPEHYSPKKKYPLILFLHGAGERGNDNSKQLVHGSSLFLSDSIRKNYPAIVVFPQCRAEGFWSNVSVKAKPGGGREFNFHTGGTPTKDMDLVQGLLRQLLNDYKVKQQQIYVGGLSMGGMGTFEIVSRNPGVFAAAFPICGGSDTSVAPGMKNVNWWVFHGAKDEVVLPEFSRQMVQALQAVKAQVIYTEYPEAGHNSWDLAFAEPGLMRWLFSHRRK